MMDTPGKRLQWARRKAGYARPADAAKAFGWNTNTYKSHENGMRGLRKPSADRYGRALRVSAGWLLTGEGDPKTLRSPREAELLASFRSLPEAEQEIVIVVCESLARRLALEIENVAQASRTGG